MPTDVRKLIFSNKELRLTFQKFCREKAIGPQEVPVESFEIVEASGASGRVVSEHTPEGMKAILRFTSHDPNNPLRAHLSEDQILEALISACKELHIPLPRRGTKFLQKHKDGIAMTIGMTQQDLLMAHAV